MLVCVAGNYYSFKTQVFLLGTRRSFVVSDRTKMLPDDWSVTVSKETISWLNNSTLLGLLSNETHSLFLYYF